MAEETKPQGQGANSSNSASANPAAYFPQHAKSADPFLAEVVQLQQVKEKCSFCGSREINFCWYESWQSDSVKIRYFCYTCERFWIQHFILVDARGSKAPSFASSFSSRENSSFQLQPQWHNLGSPQYICTTNSATAKALYITAYQVEVECSLCEMYLYESWDPFNLQAKYYCIMCGGIWTQGSDPGVDCGGIAPSTASSFSSENSRLQSQPRLHNLRLSQNISTIKSATVSVPYTTAYQTSWKAESSSGSGEIAGLMKSADSLKIEESKPQGQGATSRKTACPNPPAQKPAANRPPHAENAAAVQAEQGKSTVRNQMTQAKRKPESPGRSGEIPELTKSVDSLKVEESKPQGQEATSGKTAPANPLAEKPVANRPPRAENVAAVLAKQGKSSVANQMMQAKWKPESLKVEESKPQEQEATSGRTAPANPPAVKSAANHPPHDENAAARAKLVGGSTTKQKSEAQRKRDKEKRVKQKKRQQQKAATKGKLAAAVAAADTEKEKQEKQGEEEETKLDIGAILAATKGKPAAAADTTAIAAGAAAAATIAAVLSAIAATAKGSRSDANVLY
ncbi:hypothetical protein JCGZ_05717 [Jatropha curcas]|uniref:Uncharacterized protein n=1 Tax=Jatropha curcas TaxID=180498 RepID=A0A067LI48_JATCU|nr:hypothetical protein JCGZ_05717 [Jatropha curcas]